MDALSLLPYSSQSKAIPRHLSYVFAEVLPTPCGSQVRVPVLPYQCSPRATPEHILQLASSRQKLRVLLTS